MKRIKRILKKVSFSTIFFFTISIVSLTFAWFAYYSTSKAKIELEVLAWHVDFNNETIINLNVDELKPGMDDYVHEVDVSNDGDVDAKLTYKLKSLRVFDEEYNFDNSTEEEIQELIDSFPFDINLSYNDEYLTHGNNTKFVVNVEWEFESGNDELDTYWGEKSEEFYRQEKNKKNQDSSYVIKSSLSLEIELIAIQRPFIYFTIEGKQYKTDEYTTWGNWIQKSGVTQTSNGIIWLTLGCGQSDADIGRLQSPYNLDTRANNRYCALYLESSRTSGGTPQKVMVNSSNKVQKIDDFIENNMVYTGR